MLQRLDKLTRGAHSLGMVGRVVSFDRVRGFGFIAPAEGGRHIFVHYSGIIQGGVAFRELQPAQFVEFEVAESTRGPMATNVRVLRPNSERRRRGGEAGVGGSNL